MIMQNLVKTIDFFTNKAPLKGDIIIVAEPDESFRFLHKQLNKMGYNTIINDDSNLPESNRSDSETSPIILLDCSVFNDDILQKILTLKQNNNATIVMLIDVENQAMQHGLKAGICYYVPKPININVLCSVLQAVTFDLHQAQSLALELSKHRNSFGLMESARFSFRTLHEAESLAAFIANGFPNPKRALLGIGELMINAIEHGNLAIGYELKTELVQKGIWREEIDHRLTVAKYRNRSASIAINRKLDGIYLTIEDMGDGFMWQNYMSLDPARLTDNHGRGIALANATSFDRLTYNSIGNKAIAYMANVDEIEFC
jgi:two-component system, cell cycle response regulator